uniref:Chitobiosyldiphosphodolichol betamannosyltransferase putative n=1 Tax=Albugo laibachii Nc14 TaxID=890382 RepID=F0WWR8_9STRA|nr:chitobiosyldiphosphodolichol betamannosyltransferase putative [Albugo laibachii Nc14]|eukprot:CCA25895.1 chitobiosyldiphosphodolichol betamannosyltransferase putative [Albugo laibachii Nc14]
MQSQKRSRKPHVVVLVLGDIGRSPRMQNQSVSLASFLYDKQYPHHYNVTLIGYKGEQCIPSVTHQSNLRILPISPILSNYPRSLFFLTAPLKVLLQIFQLFYILLVCTGTTDAILVQNPPTIPTFPVVWLSCRLKGAKFLIDWHNFGYTILALSIGTTHILVRVAEVMERVFGRKADANFCVTNAMKTFLKDTWGIQAVVLHDKPPESFGPTPINLRHELFQSLSQQLKHCNDLVPWDRHPDTLELTLLTRKWRENNVIHFDLRADRPAVLISSTSWTSDEDFGLLLDALVLLDHHMTSSLPKLLVLVTGKGPEKAFYLEKIAQLRLGRIRIATLWMEAEAYPLLLGSADIGICLHTSSSGLDLPMKIVDMFGCRVPVCAVAFASLNELVLPSINGMIFSDHEELASQLVKLLENFPITAKLDEMRGELASITRWKQHWEDIAGPLIVSLIQS